jgi:long-chain-fatty-acid--[acyl-carrier-protein] ligase
VHGLDAIKKRGNNGILFLPNHPALVDPVIVTSILEKDFRARPFADQDAVNYPVFIWLVKRIRAFTIPTVHRYGIQAQQRIMEMEVAGIKALHDGCNVILYPSGSLMRTRTESVRGHSALDTFLHEVPDVRIVLLRTKGLWGSSFGMIYGKEPDIGTILSRGILQILSSFIFFTPKRSVDLFFEEPADFPRYADRNTINSYLEKFYNKDAPSALYVPYTIWDSRKRQIMSDPEWSGAAEHLQKVPSATRELVFKKLSDISRVPIHGFNEASNLATDLNMDSLMKAELVIWIEKEFGYPQNTVESIRTVADVLLAANGEVMTAKYVFIKSIPKAWFKLPHPAHLHLPSATTITDSFLDNLEKYPNRVVDADQLSGVKTFRDIAAGVFALLPKIKQQTGDRLGIMLPSSVVANIVYLTTLFAGKTPVMINWTQGSFNIRNGIDITGVRRIVTSKKLTDSLFSRGIDLKELGTYFVNLEELTAEISIFEKFSSIINSYVSVKELHDAKISDIAAILFTSGSESRPKAVPLTHSNLLTNLRDTLRLVKFKSQDSMTGMLPPFHSFGLITNVIAPLVTMLRVVHHPSPTEGAMLARIIEEYYVNIIIATPTFLNGILRAAPRSQLASLRLAITGAEGCPPEIYKAFAERCPQAVIVEGYGITECSPIVAVNRPDDPHPGTVGRLIDSLDYAIVDADTRKAVPVGEKGHLLLSGPTVFSGYLGEAPDPFVLYKGKRWYKTGDLVIVDKNGIVTFAGRMKRFVKLGGEMVSLPAIESVLNKTFAGDIDDKPVLAVVAASVNEHADLVLFTTKKLERRTVNEKIRDAGLSQLYYIRKVMKVDSIPALGTGKVNYPALERLVENRK